MTATIDDPSFFFFKTLPRFCFKYKKKKKKKKKKEKKWNVYRVRYGDKIVERF